MTLHDLVRKLFPRVPVSPCDFYVDCPFCLETVGKKDYKSRFGINTSTGVGNCHRCEKKHSAKGGKQYWFRELCRVFKVNYSIDVGERDDDSDEGQSRRSTEGVKTSEEGQESSNQTDSKKREPVRLPSEYEPLWKDVDESIAKRARKYLLSRGVTPDQIKHHRVGFCAVGKYAYRLIIPVYSSKGRLKAFVSRDFSGQNELRYLNSEGAKTLYGVPRRKRSHAVLVEGIFDAWAFERSIASVDGIAGLGKTLSKGALRTLAKYKEVTIWPDPDRPGVEGCIKRANALQKRGVIVNVVVPLDDEVECEADLGSMPVFEIQSRFCNRVVFTKAVAALMRIRVAANSSPKKKRTFVKKQTNVERVS